jgi:hypothetical protein
MPLTMEIEKTEFAYFQKPMRAIFSGSSQSGKTFLIGKMLEKRKYLFGDEFEQIKYYYPEYLDDCPVCWHDLISTPISYHSGFPEKDEILSLPKNSLIIIDDNMKKVVNSELMRQLFNVISGKQNISVICVTQNYFTQGPHSRDIRNSSNFVALFRNCADASLNKRVANAFGLGKAYVEAEKEVFQSNIHPYVFIDQTQRAQLSRYRLYIDILSNPRIAYSTTGMKGYILNEKQFLEAFKILQERKDSITATLRNEDKNKKLSDYSNVKCIKSKRSSKSSERKRKSKQLWRKFTPIESRTNLQ